MGARLGDMEILDLVASGGMAEVFRARIHDRLIAIKKILPQFTHDRDLVQMFIDEARVAAQLRHPNIVAVHDLLVSEAGEFYIGMEYADGKDLSDVMYGAALKGLRLNAPVATHVALEVLKALEFAHGARDRDGRPMNLIHRDVSPHNVMTGFDGWVKLADFGIAKVAHSGHQTMAGVVKGKFGYMSPEQARGRKIDARSDLYNVGILLYEMLSGERLLTGSSDVSTLERMRAAEVPSLAAALNCPPDLEAVMRRALEKSADDRYPDAAAFSTALADVVARNAFRSGAADVSRMMQELFAADRRPEPPPPSRRNIVVVSSAVHARAADSPLGAPPAVVEKVPAQRIVAGKGVALLDDVGVRAPSLRTLPPATDDGDTVHGPPPSHEDSSDGATIEVARPAPAPPAPRVVRSQLPPVAVVAGPTDETTGPMHPEPSKPVAAPGEATLFDAPTRRGGSSSSMPGVTPSGIVTKGSLQALPPVPRRPAEPPAVTDPDTVPVPAAGPPMGTRVNDALAAAEGLVTVTADLPMPPPPVNEPPPPDPAAAKDDERARHKRGAPERTRAKKAAADAGGDAPAAGAVKESRIRADGPPPTAQPARAGKVLDEPLPSYAADTRPQARRGAWIIGEPAISPASDRGRPGRLLRTLFPPPTRRPAAVAFGVSAVFFYLLAALRPLWLASALGSAAPLLVAGAARVAPEEGTVALTMITSPAGARLVVDGEPMEGEAPRTVHMKLEPGAHRLTAYKGRLKKDLLFDVAAGQPVLLVRAVLGPEGEVDIPIREAGATLFLDGRPMGGLPRRLDPGRERSHHLQVRLGDRVIVDQRIAPDRPVRLVVNPWEGLLGSAPVVVHSQPGAVVSMGGRDLPRLTGQDPLELPTGRHALVLRVPALGLRRELVVDALPRGSRRYHVDFFE